MKSSIAIPIQTEQFLELANFLRSNDDPRDPVEMVAHAIQYWLDNAGWKPELSVEISNDAKGYQWKNLFLPHGTQIRMQYRSTYFYAKVEGDEILYDGKPISPGSLANSIAGTSRNAWRDLWIKRPEDKEWKLAAECRKFSGKEEKFMQEMDDEFGKSITGQQRS